MKSYNEEKKLIASFWLKKVLAGEECTNMDKTYYFAKYEQLYKFN